MVKFRRIKKIYIVLSSVLFVGGPYPSGLLNGKLRCVSSTSGAGSTHQSHKSKTTTKTFEA